MTCPAPVSAGRHGSRIRTRFSPCWHTRGSIVKSKRIEQLAGINHIAQSPEIPPESVDLRSQLVGVTESVVDPLVEIEANLAMAIVLDDDPPPPIHGPLMFFGQLDWVAIVGDCRCRADPRAPATSDH